MVKKQVKLQIWKDKLYVQLFRIFENNLLNIFETIAPIKANYSVCWNKIHELHLRICAEVENLIKEVVKDYFWCDKIKKLENEHIEDEVVDKLGKLWFNKNNNALISYILDEKYEPFTYYFSLLDDKLWLSLKEVVFIWWIENYSILDKESHFIPFKVKKWKETPEWWSHYNGIKHNKLEKYQFCNLWDLINAFWAYYILLNYLVVWFKKPLQTVWVKMINPLKRTRKWEMLESLLFMPTTTYVDYPDDFYYNTSNIIQIWSDAVWKIDQMLTRYNNWKFVKYCNLKIKSLSCLYYTSLLILPSAKSYDSVRFYKIVPYMKFLNKGKEKIKTSILWNVDAEWKREYAIDNWWPHDFSGMYRWFKDD